MKNKFKWQLINDSISAEDKLKLISWLSQPNTRFTQGEYVKQFENEWSNWLGVKHSVFVNSGASANYIMASIMKEEKGLGEVIVSPLGWVSDVAPLVNLGFTPVFVDVSLDNTFSDNLASSFKTSSGKDFKFILCFFNNVCNAKLFPAIISLVIFCVVALDATNSTAS